MHAASRGCSTAQVETRHENAADRTRCTQHTFVWAVCCMLAARLLHRSSRVGLGALLDVEMLFAEAH